MCSPLIHTKLLKNENDAIDFQSFACPARGQQAKTQIFLEFHHPWNVEENFQKFIMDAPKPQTVSPTDWNTITIIPFPQAGADLR